MKLEQQVTNLELSKKLKELGVKQDSIFDWNLYREKTTGKITENVERSSGPRALSMQSYVIEDSYSAFTVAELGEMLPLLNFPMPMDKRIWSGTVVQNNGNLVKVTADTESNARAKMLIYLIENNLLNTGITVD